MPKFQSRKFAVTLDMAGCPNRCRHCWLGNPPNRRVSEETLRWVTDQFREWRRPGEAKPFVDSMCVMSWYREPDYAANYRDLWDLENELSDDDEAARFDLLSVWRLARDESYAEWARDVGTEACQISFFGLEDTTDYFTRRQGSFHDNLLATERLLNVGIRPRWQLFLTERTIPELDQFVALIDSLELEQRTHQLNHEFEVFVRTPAPDGEAFNIENLRPKASALKEIPTYLAEKTKEYTGASTLEECLGMAEMDLVSELVYEYEPFAVSPDTLAFLVTPELDVYSNIGEPMPWWRLGNLRSDDVELIMRRFEYDEVPGLHLNYRVPVALLAHSYGREDSDLLYTRTDLILRWMRLWGENTWRRAAQSDSTVPRKNQTSTRHIDRRAEFDGL